jgi:hypothetical protein
LIPLKILLLGGNLLDGLRGEDKLQLIWVLMSLLQVTMYWGVCLLWGVDPEAGLEADREVDPEVAVI